MYNETVMDHFQNPRNVGEIPDASGIGEIGNAVCGDILRLYIKVKDGMLDDVKYMTFGCGAAVASGSMLTTLAKGRSVEEAQELTNKNVADALGGLPPQKMHCSNLAADALHKAIEDWLQKTEKETNRMGVSTNLPSASYKVRKVEEKGWHDQTDLIVKEKAITIYVNSGELATVVCSPAHLVYMTVGFLCSEGILCKRQDLTSITVDEDKGLVHVKVNGYEHKPAGKDFLKRYITPCCGRGRASFYFSTDALLCRKVVSDVKIPACKIRSLSGELEERSRLFRRTGGVHNAALAVSDRILIFQEDVGRHNTLDKIMGQCFLEEIPFDDKIIIFSGRVSSEILLKVAKMGVPILVSRSAPTDLALELAEDLGITVVGFARGENFNIYTHCERVLVGEDVLPVFRQSRDIIKEKG